MIKLEKVSKYFNRHRANQITPINGTSLEFEAKGLVTFLGPSGCGKTTLLNAIGGLDKVDKGRIFVNGERITGRRSGKVDTIRNREIGYIFQNYNLLDDLSVFDNVAMVLRMNGFRNKQALENRVMYVLDRIGIARYKKRPAKMLSGGERQRVGIARAIVKNPAIIIADEPTGNLDSANTIEVMNIIKAISKEKLVILVTHEKEIAEFYSDRIIEILDGTVVSDRLNSNEGKLDLSIDTTIHLKDMAYQKELEQGSVRVHLYSDREELPPRINVVIRNGSIYVDTGGVYHRGAEDIQLVDDHYQGFTKEMYEKYQFDYDTYYKDAEKIEEAKLIQEQEEGKAASTRKDNRLKVQQKAARSLPKKPHYKPIYTFFNSLGKGLVKVSHYSRLKKILLVGFIISAMFVLYSVSAYLGVRRVTDDAFMTADRSYVQINTGPLTADQYEQLKAQLLEIEGTKYVMPGNSMLTISLPLRDYLQSSDRSATRPVSLASTDLLTEGDLIAGRLPEKDTEIVMDRQVFKLLMQSPSQLREVGADSLESMLGRPAKLGFFLPEYTIVGVCDRLNPSIFVTGSEIDKIVMQSLNYGGGDLASHAPIEEDKILPYSLFAEEESLQIVKGQAPENDYEVLAPDTLQWEVRLGRKLNIKVNGENLVVSGFYHDDWGGLGLYVTDHTALINSLPQFKEITVSSTDKTALIDALRQTNAYEVTDLYEQDAERYRLNREGVIARTLMTGLVLIGVSLLEMYLMLRASFLSRVKEIGVLRAIGLKKSDIYKMFIGEITAITLLTTLPGMAFMGYILYHLANNELFQSSIMMNGLIFGATLVAVYLFNLFAGLLPVFGTLRKTPAQILARNDVN